METLPIELINKIISYYPPHKVAKIIKNKVLEVNKADFGEDFDDYYNEEDEENKFVLFYNLKQVTYYNKFLNDFKKDIIDDLNNIKKINTEVKWRISPNGADCEDYDSYETHEDEIDKLYKELKKVEELLYKYRLCNDVIELYNKSYDERIYIYFIENIYCYIKIYN